MLLTTRQKYAVIDAGGMLFDGDIEAVLPGPVAIRRVQTDTGYMADVHTPTRVFRCEPIVAADMAFGCVALLAITDPGAP